MSTSVPLLSASPATVRRCSKKPKTKQLVVLDAIREESNSSSIAASKPKRKRDHAAASMITAEAIQQSEAAATVPDLVWVDGFVPLRPGSHMWPPSDSPMPDIQYDLPYAGVPYATTRHAQEFNALRVKTLEEAVKKLDASCIQQRFPTTHIDAMWMEPHWVCGSMLHAAAATQTSKRCRLTNPPSPCKTSIDTVGSAPAAAAASRPSWSTMETAAATRVVPPLRSPISPTPSSAST